MDEIINISVNGNSLKKDYNGAGVQGDCNSTKLRITFSENWDVYAKIITFWNALGQNPVQIQLGTNLLEDILVSHRVYVVPIPGEAMTESGENTFVIHGIVDGSVKRTVEGKLKVLPSMQADNAGEPVDPTPTQAEQLRAELDAVIEDIEDAKEAATEAATNAKEAKDAAFLAVESKEAITEMTVSSETLAPGAAPTVAKWTADGVYNLHFGIPNGESGVYIGASAPTDESMRVWIDTDDVGDDPYGGYYRPSVVQISEDAIEMSFTGSNPEMPIVGSSVITLARGADGAKGDKGDTGANGKDGTNGKDGANGKDGYTPVRGKDYWTEADKAEIKSYVDDAILGGAW